MNEAFSGSLEDFVKQFGFDDEKDFHHLVATVDLSSPEKVAAFKAWQFVDGTKAGLLKLPASKNRHVSQQPPQSPQQDPDR